MYGLALIRFAVFTAWTWLVNIIIISALYFFVWQIKFANGRYAVRLQDVNSDDSGLYMCVVTNDYGRLNWTVKLNVIGSI